MYEVNDPALNIITSQKGAPSLIEVDAAIFNAINVGLGKTSILDTNCRIECIIQLQVNQMAEMV